MEIFGNYEVSFGCFAKGERVGNLRVRLFSFGGGRDLLRCLFVCFVFFVVAFRPYEFVVMFCVCCFLFLGFYLLVLSSCADLACCLCCVWSVSCFVFVYCD